MPTTCPVLLALALALLPAALARPAAADTPALGFTANATGFEDTAAGFGQTSYVLGWSFTVNSPLTVTSLGWDYDPLFGTSAVPFAAPAATGTHAVGLYDSLGTLLTSATVAYTGGGSIGFSYAAAPPVSLAAGLTYTLAGVTGATDPFFYDIQDPTLTSRVGLLVAPALTYKQDQIAVGSVLSDPAGTDAPLADPGYFGPSFQFRPNAAVPEAPAGALLALGLLPAGLLLARRRA